MLVPTMACQAGCRYCYAKKSGERMSMETAERAIAFMDRISAGQPIRIIFHGGEPLLAGHVFYEQILPVLRERFGRRARLAIQSNLWAMDEEFARLFRKYEVEVSTSIDGYPEMCDDQRGEGYYERTQAGAAIFTSAGKGIGRICTFSSAHVHDAERVFREAEAPYTIHGAIPTYGEGNDGLSLTPAQFTKILLDTYHVYRDDLSHTRVGLLDTMASALLHKKAGLCTFSACLGQYAAITPGGDLYSCQRFSGIREFCLGNIWDDVNEEKILQSKAYRLLYEKTEEMRSACGDCIHFPNCNGGCLYSAFTAGTAKDPYCETYRTVFDEMLTDMGHEIADVMLDRETARTPVLSMAGDRPHPYDERIKRERIQKWVSRDGSQCPAFTDPFPENQLNKVFFNLTARCPLHCTHCWAANRERESRDLPAETYANLIDEAIQMRFRRIVLTGGEPLVYRDFDKLVGMLAGIDKKGVELILRTSFAFPISEERMRNIASIFDRVVVSIDGDRASHDARRGQGTYERTVRNLEDFSRIASPRKLGLWSVLSAEQLHGKEGRAVKELGDRLGGGMIHFDALKPMGNACYSECDLTTDLPERAEDLRIRSNCGLGHILHVEPDGKAYPCYACMTPETMLADLSREPLSALRDRLFAYASVGVDSNEKCSHCELRYLCGGLCLAYRPHPETPDSGDFDCEARKKALHSLLAAIQNPRHQSPSAPS